MLYRAECWVVKMQHIDKMSMVEMRMLKWINGYTQNDRIRNEEIHLKIRIAPIDEKMRESCLGWFGHVQRRAPNALITKSELIQVVGIFFKKKCRRQPKITLVELIKNDMLIKEVTKSMTLDGIEWRKR